ncbi:hypothetical protein Z052_16575 [Halorubrum sp. C191]|nr:hypothetical protein Z052_16575 [Halorubrum sp. C191]
MSRLAPTVSAGQLGDVELEGWVTSSAVMAQDYNSSRSNKRKTQAGDTDSDSDGDGVGDGSEEDADLVAYLGGERLLLSGSRCVCLMRRFRVGMGVSVRR